ncbi:hypothetical protein LCGC14_2253200, partial [marine sediment metagenome]
LSHAAHFVAAAQGVGELPYLLQQFVITTTTVRSVRERDRSLMGK